MKPTVSLMCCLIWMAAALPSADLSASETAWLPESRVFPLLLADPREPRLTGSFRRIYFKGDSGLSEGRGKSLSAGLIGAAGDVGIWERRDGIESAFQVGMFGAIFSQFNLNTPPGDLLNADYQFGFPVSLRSGSISARIRVYHQSSHLGDQLLLTGTVRRIPLSYETLDALVGYDFNHWRMYFGSGYIFRSGSASHLDPWSLHFGAEKRASGNSAAPVFGIDLKAHQQAHWNIAASAIGGLEWGSKESTRRLRVVGVIFEGYAPYGQFWLSDQIESFGVECQIDI